MAERNPGGNDYLGPTIVALGILAVLIWLVGGDYLRAGTMWVARAEWVLVKPFASVLTDAGLVERWERVLGRDAEQIATMEPADLWAVLTVAGEFIRWPLALVLAGLAGWIFHRSPTLRFNRTMDMEALLRVQANAFPRIRPILHLKGRTTREARGAYWWPLNPFEWAAGNRVISAGGSATAVRESFNAKAAAAGFAGQLGAPMPPVSGDRVSLEPLAFHEELMVAILAARIMGKKKEAAQLMDDAAVGFGPSWSAKERLVRQIRGTLLDWPVNGPWEIVLPKKTEAILAQIREEVERGSAGAPVRKILAGHAYVRVAIAHLMEAAQTTGIITTSDFIWVKAVDRTLHYVLNDVGRRVASSEASGVRSHFIAERDAGRRIPKPQVEDAVKALRSALAESGWQAPPTVNFAEMEKMAEKAEAWLERERELDALRDREADQIAAQASAGLVTKGDATVVGGQGWGLRAG